ncbi:unnamed protein product [Trichobilharzia regenti]|nr:unnamed protein product [Trichobilharzia regenti]
MVNINCAISHNNTNDNNKNNNNDSINNKDEKVRQSVLARKKSANIGPNDNSLVELCDTNPLEHLHDSVLQNCSPVINTSEFNNDSDLNQSESLLPPKDDCQSNDIISTDTPSTPTPPPPPTTTTTIEEEEGGEGILRIIPECNETDNSSGIPQGANYNASFIPLSALPMLELDEE